MNNSNNRDINENDNSRFPPKANETQSNGLSAVNSYKTDKKCNNNLNNNDEMTPDYKAIFNLKAIKIVLPKFDNTKPPINSSTPLNNQTLANNWCTSKCNITQTIENVIRNSISQSPVKSTSPVTTSKFTAQKRIPISTKALVPKNLPIQPDPFNPALTRLIDDAADGYIITAPSLVCPYLFEINPEKSFKSYLDEIKIVEHGRKSNTVQNYFEEIGLEIVNGYLNMKSQNSIRKNESVQLEIRNNIPGWTLKNEDSTGNENCSSQNSKVKNDIENLENSAIPKEYKSFSVSKQIKCKLCKFRTKSVLQMSYHLKFPHLINGRFFCNFCKFYVKDDEIIMYHMRTEHQFRGILDTPVRWYECPYCPMYKSKQSRFLDLHIQSCNGKRDIPGKLLRKDEIVSNQKDRLNRFCWEGFFDLPNTYCYTSKLIVDQFRALLKVVRPHLFDKNGRMIRKSISTNNSNDRIQKPKKRKHLNITVNQNFKSPTTATSSNAGNKNLSYQNNRMIQNGPIITQIPNFPKIAPRPPNNSFKSVVLVAMPQISNNNTLKSANSTNERNILPNIARRPPNNLFANIPFPKPNTAATTNSNISKKFKNIKKAESVKGMSILSNHAVALAVPQASKEITSSPGTIKIQKYTKKRLEILQKELSENVLDSDRIIRNIKCELCCVFLDDTNKFLFHLYTVHRIITTGADGVKLIVCYACSQQFKAHLDFKKHIIDAHINKNENLTNSSQVNVQKWACDFCLKEKNSVINFLSAETYNQHIKRNHLTKEQKLTNNNNNKMNNTDTEIIGNKEVNMEIETSSNKENSHNNSCGRKILTSLKRTKLNELKDANKNSKRKKLDVATIKEIPKIDDQTDVISIPSDDQADVISIPSDNDDDVDSSKEDTLRNKFGLKTPCIILNKLAI